MYKANIVVLGVLSNPSDGSRTRINEVLDVSVYSRSSIRVVLLVGYLAPAVQLQGHSRVVELDENGSRWGLGASLSNFVVLGGLDRGSKT